MNNFFELPQFLCLERMVGISRKTFECMAEMGAEKIASAQYSETGLYVDEHDGAVECLFLDRSKCGEGDVWDKLLLARREAVLQMILDTSVHLDNRYATIEAYSHSIGESGYSTLLGLVSGIQAIKFKTKVLHGAKLQFTDMGILAKIMSTNGHETVRVSFRNITKAEVIKEVDFDVRMIQGTFSRSVDTNLYQMPIVELFCDGSEYEISYVLDTDKIAVYDNDTICNCGGVRKTLGKYFEALPDGKAKGLRFHVNYVCDENYLLCGLANSGTTVRYLIAEGIRCLTMYKFLNNARTQSSFGASIENVLNTSGLDGIIGAFSNKYSQVMLDIQAKTLLTPNFGCFTCNTSGHSRREGIMVSDVFADVPTDYRQITGGGIYQNPFST